MSFTKFQFLLQIIVLADESNVVNQKGRRSPASCQKHSLNVHSKRARCGEWQVQFSNGNIATASWMMDCLLAASDAQGKTD